MTQTQTPLVKWTIREVLTWTSARFAQADIDTPLLDAQLLMCKILNCSKINLYMDIDKPLSSDERVQLRELVKRRLNGEPVAYILGEKHWYNCVFKVDSRVLIPRPETELLVDFVVDACKHYEKSPHLIFDFCTGSGCLAIALAKIYPEANVIGIDISQQALDLAKENAALNHIENVEWLCLDLTSPESYEKLLKTYGTAQVIVANPPYVSEKEWVHLDISVKNYEPKIALTADNEGLFIGQQIVNFCDKFSLLNKDFSVFVMELAHGQPRKVVASSLEMTTFNAPMRDRKVNVWTGFSDFDHKERFLCRIHHLS